MGMLVKIGRMIAAIALIFCNLWPASAQAVPAQATVEWSQPQTNSSSFKKATGPLPLKFPEDFGAHPEFQTEWWYYTGNLQSENGQEFGYQFTIFRRAIDPAPPQQSQSDWRSNQIYFAHFTISDINNQDFYPQEQFSRGAAKLAGAETKPYRIWINDWSIEEEGNSIHLKARGDKVAINLNLEQTQAPVLQGDRGYSVKGPEPGNASYYYSIVQQPTAGSVQVGKDEYAVKGKSWTDHEYSTSALSPGTAGWDWFSIQFDDQTALMLYALRQEDGTPLEFSKGKFIEKDGSTVALNREDWNLKAIKHWKSPESKTVYPSAWAINIPKLDLSLQGQPLMPNQELNISTVYWEGAVEFKGKRGDSPISAKGYVELTGYKEALSSLR